MTNLAFGYSLLNLLSLIALVSLAFRIRQLIALIPAVLLPVLLTLQGILHPGSGGVTSFAVSVVLLCSSLLLFRSVPSQTDLPIRLTTNVRIVEQVLIDSISVCPYALQPIIERSLQQVADYFSADYAQIAMRELESEAIKCAYELCPAGIAGWKDDLSDLKLLSFPWLNENMLSGKIFQLSSVNELPTDAIGERALPYLTAGIKSAVFVPLQFDGKVTGLLILGSFSNELSWSDGDFEELRVLGKAFGSSAARNRAALEVIESESKYREAFDNAPFGMYRNTLDGHVISVNTMLATMFGADSVHDFSDGKVDIATQFYVYPEERELFVAEVLATDGFVCRELLERKIDGKQIYVRSKMRAVRDSAGAPVYLEGFIEDITESKQASVSLQKRLEFDKLITEIVAVFASSDTKDIDHNVNVALARLAGALRADQAYIILVSDDGRSYSATHEWVGENIPPLSEVFQNIPMGFSPWTEGQILSDLVVNIATLTDYPEEAKEEINGLPVNLGRKSVLGVPIHGRSGKIAGMISMGSFGHEVDWSDSDITKLRIAGDAVVGVLERKNTEEASHRQAAYDELISKTLFRFATCGPENIDSSVELALEDICQVFTAERGFVTLFSDDMTRYSCTYEWCDSRFGPAKPLFQNVALGTLPYLENMVLADKVVSISGQLGSGATHSTFNHFTAEIRSRLIVPIHGLAGTIIGMIGLNCYRDGICWSDKGIAQVRLLGDAIANVIERKKTDVALKATAEFDELIAKLLAGFATCASKDLDEQINSAIGEIALYIGADQAQVNMVSSDRTNYSCVNEWAADGAPQVKDMMQNILVGTTPWCESMLLNDQVVRLPDLQNFDDGLERPRTALYTTLGFKSQLIIPIHNGEVTGSIGMACYAEKLVWRDSDIRQLKVVGDSIASLIDRKRAEDEVLNLNASLEQRIERRTDDLEQARKRAIEIMNDVDEQRRRAEEALTRLEFTTEHLRLLSQAVDSSPAMVMITDNAHLIEYVNRKFTDVTGYTPEEVLGKSPIFLQSDVDSEGVNHQMSLALSLGQHWSGEICSRRKNNQIFWEYASFAPIKGPEGEVRHYVAVKEDVTERRAMQDELRLARDAAEAANRSKSLFLANMSHEIRTPMNAILGFSQLLQNSNSFVGLQKQHIDIINRSGEHLLSLINDILEMSRIEAGRMLLNMSVMDIKALVNDLSVMFRMRCADKNIGFTVKYADDLPRYINTDETKIRQILTNLIGNAVKLTELGSVVFRIEIGAAVDGHYRLIADIEDTGPGISEQERHKVFRPFEQTTSGINSRSGTGLGLAISQQFAQMLGGEITFVSSVGVGTTFRLSVRVDEVNDVNVDIPPTLKRVISLMPESRIRRVLVVDDEPENRTLLSSLLNQVGFETREEPDGERCIRAFEEWKPDLIMLDVQMPVMDGFEAVRHLRGTDGGRLVPIIAVSASAYEDDRKRMIESGANEFLAKPLRVDNLYSAIAAVSGASFQYNDLQSDSTRYSKVQASSTELKEHVAALPDLLASQIRAATIDADFDKVIALVDQISDSDKAVADSLREMAEQYEATRIISLLTPEA